MDKEQMEVTDSDQHRYQLRNRTTTVSGVRHKWRPCHANLPTIVGCIAEGRSEEEVSDANQGVSPPRVRPQLSPTLEVERDSQGTSSVISNTPPTLQPDTFSPYSCVAIDTQTHNARTTNIAHPQYTDTQSITSASVHRATQTLPCPLFISDSRNKLLIFYRSHL